MLTFFEGYIAALKFCQHCSASQSTAVQLESLAVIPPARLPNRTAVFVICGVNSVELIRLSRRTGGVVDLKI